MAQLKGYDGGGQKLLEPTRETTEMRHLIGAPDLGNVRASVHGKIPERNGICP